MYIGELHSKKSLRRKRSSSQRYSSTKLSAVQHSDMEVPAGKGAEPSDRDSPSSAAGAPTLHLGMDNDGSGVLPQASCAANATKVARMRRNTGSILGA